MKGLTRLEVEQCCWRYRGKEEWEWRQMEGLLLKGDVPLLE